MFYGWDYPYSLVFITFIFFALAALLCFSLIITALFDSVIVQNYIVPKYV